MKDDCLALFYLGIVLISVGISGYLTYLGFKSTFEELAWAFTLLVVLGLLAADRLIQRYREAGESLLWPLVMFSIVVFFSFVSNFNKLYTNFMEDRVIAETLRTQLNVFRTDLTETRTRLANLPSVVQGKALRDRIDVELEQMYEQATDPGRPGCSTLCREHMDEIARLTGPLTDLSVPRYQGDYPDFLRNFDAFFAGTYKSLVSETFSKKPEYQMLRDAEAVIVEIETVLANYADAEELQQRGGLIELADMARITDEIERRANALLQGEPVSHQQINPNLGKLGEIVYSLHNGFVERPDLGATGLSAIASLIVDLFPLIFALIVFRPETPIDDEAVSDDDI